MIYRCLFNSYQIVNFYYFTFISIPLGFITIISYFCVNHSILALSLLQLCSIEFLILRLQSIGEDISNELNYSSKPVRLTLKKKSYFNFTNYLKIINDIIVQHKEINKLFDATTGRIYLTSLMGNFDLNLIKYLKISRILNLISFFISNQVPSSILGIKKTKLT